MKRIIPIILILSLMLSLLSGCGTLPVQGKTVTVLTSKSGVSAIARAVGKFADAVAPTDSQGHDSNDSTQPGNANHTEYNSTTPEFNGLSDPNLLSYLEDDIYSELVKDLNSEDYFVENVSAVYISKEYLEE